MLIHTRGYTSARTHTQTLPPLQSVKYLAAQAVLVNTVLMAVINETCSLAGTLISKSLSQSWQRSERSGHREPPPHTFRREKKAPRRRENNYTFFTRLLNPPELLRENHWRAFDEEDLWEGNLRHLKLSLKHTGQILITPGWLNVSCISTLKQQ